MKWMLVIMLLAIVAAVLLAPFAADKEAQIERARAARIAEETRLEQARADVAQARADAFGVRTVALLPWGLLIVAIMFVGSLLVLVAFRPHQERTVDAMSKLPPQIGTGPVYFVQGPHESPEAFMMRVAMAARQIDAPRQ